jgi:hypothetical protein
VAVRAIEDPRVRLGALGLVLLLGLLCIVGLFRARQQPPEAARLAVDAFLGRLAAGNLSGAYDQLCNDTRRQVEREDFVAGIGARPAVTTFAIEAVTPTGPAGATVRATLADPVGAASTYDLLVVDDRGTWRVCGSPLSGDDAPATPTPAPSPS